MLLQYSLERQGKGMLAGSVFQGRREENIPVWGFALAAALLT